MRIENENLRLADYQASVLYDPARFTVTEASTKTGKTFSHLFWLFEIAHGGNPIWYNCAVKRGWHFWWVAPVYGQAKIAFDRLSAKVIGNPAYKINNSKLTITTPLGTIIDFKSADRPDSLYGEDVYAAVFDEFTRAKEAAWFALRSTLTATKGPCKFIGNYTGSTNWGHKLSKKALTSTQYTYHKITAIDAVKAGILDQEEVDQAREDLPELIFKALYMAEGSIDDAVLYDEKALTAWYTNDHVEEGYDRYLTCDIAMHGSDRFVIVVWYGWVIVDIIPFRKLDGKQVEEKIKEVAKLHRVPQHHIAYDADGLGAYLEGYLESAIPFHNGASPIIKEGKQKVNYKHLKAQCAYEFAKRVARGETWNKVTKYKEKVNAEFEQIKKFNSEKDGKVTITPKEIIKGILGFSPDLAESIFMREIFELQTTWSPWD